MLQENAIEVNDIRKQFRIYYDKGSSLKERILFRERNKYKVRNVLNGISFSIKKGEAVGLIGHNGCGKSTTLKLLTKIIYPDSGTINIDGRVSSLLELGAGFHPDMSGRDNIYINASIFGLTKKEIDERMDDIIEFSELKNYIDNPVRTYSSGMYMRLAFSVAINVNADVILIDEILAVGDLNFQQKCLKHMQMLKQSGTTIVLVSHSLEQIESFCDRTIWLNDGVIVEDDIPGLVHRKYLEFMGTYNFEDSAATEDDKNAKEKKSEEEISEEEAARIRFERKGNGQVRLKKIYCCDSTGEEKKVFSTGEDIVIHIPYKVFEPTELNIYLGVLRTDYMLCYSTELVIDEKRYFYVEKDGEFILMIPKVQLLTSRYLIDLRLTKPDGSEIDVYNEATEIFIFNEDNKEQGMIHLEHKWINSEDKENKK